MFEKFERFFKDCTFADILFEKTDSIFRLSKTNFQLIK